MQSALVFVLAFLLLASCGQNEGERQSESDPERIVPIRYLEFVTQKVGETCSALAAIHRVEFGEPVAELGNARTAKLASGNRFAVRAPMAEHEQPIVRAYMLVDNVEAAVKQAESAGATIAHPPMKIPGQGTFAIYVLGGTQHGLWQDDPLPPSAPGKPR